MLFEVSILIKYLHFNDQKTNQIFYYFCAIRLYYWVITK